MYPTAFSSPGEQGEVGYGETKAQRSPQNCLRNHSYQMGMGTGPRARLCLTWTLLARLETEVQQDCLTGKKDVQSSFHSRPLEEKSKRLRGQPVVQDDIFHW